MQLNQMCVRGNKTHDHCDKMLSVFPSPLSRGKGFRMKGVLFITVLNLALVFSSLFNFPDYIHVCHRSDPHINQCVAKSVEDLRPKLILGIPELNVPSLEPLYIKELVPSQGTGLRIVSKDIRVYGCANFTVQEIKLDIGQGLIDFVLHFDHLHIEGIYDVDGKIMMLPLKGSGKMMTDAYEIKANVELSSVVYEKLGGEKYLKFVNMTIDFNVGKGKVHLDNLFGGERMGELINAAINLNFKFFIKELSPTITATLSEFMLYTANSIMENVPYDLAFPE